MLETHSYGRVVGYGDKYMNTLLARTRDDSDSLDFPTKFGTYTIVFSSCPMCLLIFASIVVVNGRSILCFLLDCCYWLQFIIDFMTN